MKWSRFALAGFLVLGLALVGTAGTDNSKKIVGLWELSKTEDKGPPPGTTVQFTKDGKLKLHMKFGDKEFDLDGSYKVNGAKVSITIEFGGKSKTEMNTIETLTADRLVLKDEKGKSTEFKRLKKK